MAKKPKSVEELIPYLQANPNVRMVQYKQNTVLADEDRVFLRYDNKNGFQRLFFEDKTGEVFIPLVCPLTSGLNTSIRFLEDRFSVLVLDLKGEELAQFHYYYKDGKNAASDNSD